MTLLNQKGLFQAARSYLLCLSQAPWQHSFVSRAAHKSLKCSSFIMVSGYPLMLSRSVPFHGQGQLR